MFTYYLADKLKDDGITVNCYTPGFTRSNFAKGYKFMRLFSVLFYPLATSSDKGAKSAILLAASSDMNEITGKYFHKLKEKNSSDLTYDKKLQKVLWDLSKKLVKI